jgi:hypothetical protein
MVEAVPGTDLAQPYTRLMGRCWGLTHGFAFRGMVSVFHVTQSAMSGLSSKLLRRGVGSIVACSCCCHPAHCLLCQVYLSMMCGWCMAVDDSNLHGNHGQSDYCSGRRVLMIVSLSQLRVIVGGLPRWVFLCCRVGSAF